jgi:1,2-diacylglycerol 3-beta-glucosyltransferase
MSWLSLNGQLIVQLVVGVGTSIALLYFGVMVVTRAVKGDVAKRSPDQPLHYVFLIPCLNESLVIASTIDRLLLFSEKISVYVIDDGSTDDTAAIVEGYAGRDARVRLIRRTLPNARQGKGPALNAAYRVISQEFASQRVDPVSVVVCIMDADGVLDVNAIQAVDGLFGHPDVGAAQIVVRIANRESFRGRLQDVDFFVFASIIQQGRNHIGSVGLGGNGQFTRLSALDSLGDAPWSDCLTEDLDLGLRLVTRGWRLAFASDTAVHQQGLVNIRRLLRQRTRWVQGHFQCWRRIPDVLRMDARWYTRTDLVFYLLWPAVSCLVLPAAVLGAWIMLGYSVTRLNLSPWQWLAAVVLGYLLTFGPNLLLGFHYRARSKDISILGTIALVHLMVVYQYIWFVAGWWAIFRMVGKRTNWTKTERVAIPTSANT